MQTQIVFNEAKFKELILYVASQCKDHPYFGMTELNKILFFSDFLAYKQLGAPITGAEYVAFENGPGTRRLFSISEDMYGYIFVEGLGSQQRVIALHSPNLENFSFGEKAIIDSVIAALNHQDVESVNDFPYKFLGWQAARAEFMVSERIAVIPYETVFVSNKLPNDSDIARAKVLAEKHGWYFK